MSREVVTLRRSEMRNEDSHSPCGECSTKPRSGCIGPPIRTGASMTSASSLVMFICASTSPSRYSLRRLIMRPIAPSSPCWQRNVTPRAKFGSRSAGIAIRSWFVSGLDSAMARLYWTALNGVLGESRGEGGGMRGECVKTATVHANTVLRTRPSSLSPVPRSAIAQDIARQKLPRPADVKLVDLLLVLRQRRERLGEVDDADRGVVEHLVAARLDHVDALDVPVAREAHGQHELSVQLLAACFSG